MVKQGLVKTIIKFKKELIYLTIGLALAILLFNIFNNPILENVENMKKLEITLMKPVTDSSANNAFYSLWTDIKSNYTNNNNIIFEEKMCSGSILEDFLKTCTEGNLTYTNFLQAKAPTWKNNCPALIVTILDSTLVNTGSGRTYINELGFETAKNSITLAIAKEVIDKAKRDYFPPAPLPVPPVPEPTIPPPVETPVPGPPPTTTSPPIPAPSNPPTPVLPSQGPIQGPPVPTSQTSLGSPYTTTTITTTTTTR